ncbi:hypothetical protein G6F65_018354 [Rhizopus arrhizus]|nr:hypothetical protein G6F65_018354 [Rhizopus arrhizus]
MGSGATDSVAGWKGLPGDLAPHLEGGQPQAEHAADVGQHEGQHHAGDAVAVPALQALRIVAQFQEVLVRRFAQPRFHQRRERTGRDAQAERLERSHRDRGEDAQRMATGQQAAQARQATGIHRPGRQQFGTHAQSTAIEAHADAGRHDGQDAQREPRNVALLRHRLQFRAQRRRCLGVGFQVARQPGQVAGTDHGQHFALLRVVLFAQARGHVAGTLAEDGLVQRRALAGELAEARFQHVALLEFLDLVLAHFLG